MKEDVHYFRLVELRNKRYVHEREKSVEMLVSFFVNTMKKAAIVVSSIVLSNLLANGVGRCCIKGMWGVGLFV